MPLPLPSTAAAAAVGHRLQVLLLPPRVYEGMYTIGFGSARRTITMNA